jgi:hypothetical protein
MDKYLTALEAKVAALNHANALIMVLQSDVLKTLVPFVGQKVFNQGNTLSAKVRSALPNLGSNSEVQGWYQTSNYSLTLHVKVCARYAGRDGQYHSCVYQEAYAHLGEIDGHTLKSIGTLGEFRTNYTVEEVKAAREELTAAQRAVSEAQGNGVRSW